MATLATDVLTVLTDAESPIYGRTVYHGLVRFLKERQADEAVSARKLFVFTSATRLDRLAEVISASNKHNRLQALLVESDVEPEWVPFMLKRAGLRTLRNMLVHQGSALPQRVLNAWVQGQHHESIAAATIVGERLLVVSCAFDAFEVGFDVYPALARIPVAERGEFEIEEDGVFLHWPEADVHLDLHDIRVALDPRLRARATTRKLAHDKAFGDAVRTLRQKHGIAQTAIPDLSSRHVRRIENGYVPGVEAIDALARAHGLDPDAYLGLVTEMMD